MPTTRKASNGTRKRNRSQRRSAARVQRPRCVFDVRERGVRATHNEPSAADTTRVDLQAMRDQCIAEKGEDACQDLIEKHKECLRAEGFNV